MTREEVLQDLRDRFDEDIIDIYDKSPRRVYMEIKPRAIRWVGNHIFRELGARFNIASASDKPKHTEILYHFILENINLMINVRVKLDKENPKIRSLAPDIEAFNWIEREMSELLGIEFIGHPDPRRLLLADNWPEGVYPLKLDYDEWDDSAIRTRGV
jgi:Ni,Fe-hydrogenase III component G